MCKRHFVDARFLGARKEPQIIANSELSSEKVIREDDLDFLNFDQVKMIDEALSSIDKYGEVRLVLDNHRLRFIECQVSYDANGYKPGVIRKKGKGETDK